jgi:hypothetical protein
MRLIQILDGRYQTSMPYNHIPIDFDLKLRSLLLVARLDESGGRLIERPRLDRYINVPLACHGLLQRCWEELPADRPSMAVIVSDLRSLADILGVLPPPRM